LSGVTGLAGQFSPAGRVGAAIGPAISGLAGGGRSRCCRRCRECVRHPLGRRERWRSH
jgi:hypothetical protein